MDYKIEDHLNAEEYNQLKKSVGWDAKEISIVERALKQSIIVKKVILDNTTVGMARAIGDGLYYLIVDVVVDPKYQKKGIGKLLIESTIEEIEKKMVKGQACSIHLVSMKGKEAFYEKCGFRKIPFDYTGYGMIRKIIKE